MPSPWKSVDPKLIRLAMVATTIPFVMGAGPLVGWLLGGWIGKAVGHEGMGSLIGLVLGLATAAREAINMTRRIIRELKEQK